MLIIVIMFYAIEDFATYSTWTYITHLLKFTLKT